MVALHKSFMDAPGATDHTAGRRVLADETWVREVRREAHERELQAVEDYDRRAPIGDGHDWTGSVNE